MEPKTVALMQEFLDEYEAIPRWDTLRTQRLHSILPMVLDNVEGDILEIGAHKGTSTVVFCDAAHDRGRNVTVIDPWDGRQQGSHKVHQEFKTATANRTNLAVLHMGSENPLAREKLLADGTRFAFILIDGLHSYPAVKNDITQYQDLLNPGGVICIDDWTGPYGFAAAIQKAAKDHLDDKWRWLAAPESFIESYFVKLP